MCINSLEKTVYDNLFPKQIIIFTPKKSSLFVKSHYILKIRKFKTHGDNLRNHLKFFQDGRRRSHH